MNASVQSFELFNAAAKNFFIAEVFLKAVRKQEGIVFAYFAAAVDNAVANDSDVILVYYVNRTVKYSTAVNVERLSVRKLNIANVVNTGSIIDNVFGRFIYAEI